jgi:hypothetical protein
LKDFDTEKDRLLKAIAKMPGIANIAKFKFLSYGDFKLPGKFVSVVSAGSSNSGLWQTLAILAISSYSLLKAISGSTWVTRRAGA